VPERRLSFPRLDPRSLPGPGNIIRTTLQNGVVILVRENRASPSVVLTGYLKAGGLDETEDTAGLAHFAAGSLMRGTARRSFQQIYESIELIGASLGVGAGKERTTFHGKALAEDLRLLLDLLAEVLRQPTFPEEEIERYRSERLTALNIRDQDTGSVAGLEFGRLAFPDHPYSIPSDGYKESVSRLRREDLVAFHQAAYGPAGMVLSIVGDVDAGAAAAAVDATLGDWRNPMQKPLAAVPGAAMPSGLLRRDRVLPGKSQCDVILGAPGAVRSLRPGGRRRARA
jgi:zinc protease